MKAVGMVVVITVTDPSMAHVFCLLTSPTAFGLRGFSGRLLQAGKGLERINPQASTSRVRTGDIAHWLGARKGLK
jgi:hypothetical protein